MSLMLTATLEIFVLALVTYNEKREDDGLMNRALILT